MHQGSVVATGARTSLSTSAARRFHHPAGPVELGPATHSPGPAYRVQNAARTAARPTGSGSGPEHPSGPTAPAPGSALPWIVHRRVKVRWVTPLGEETVSRS